MSVGDSTVSMVVESLWETLLTCPYAADCFLLHIKREFGGQATHKTVVRAVCCVIMPYGKGLLQPGLVDVSIVLMLFSDTHSQLADKCYPMIVSWLENGVFPFVHLTAIVRMKSTNEVREAI